MKGSRRAENVWRDLSAFGAVAGLRRSGPRPRARICGSDLHLLHAAIHRTTTTLAAPVARSRGSSRTRTPSRKQLSPAPADVSGFMSTDPTLLRIVEATRRFSDFRDCIIGYVGDDYSRVLFHPQSSPESGSRIAVVIERVAVSNAGEAKELFQNTTLAAGTAPAKPPTILSNRGRIGPELIGAGLSCTFTAFAAIGVIGGVAAEVPSGGAATFLVVAAWAGFATNSIQCLNGLARVGAALVRPDADTLERWDANWWYAKGTLLVDAIGVVGTIGSLPFAVRNLWAVLARQRAFVSRGLSFEALRAMNRIERQKVIVEVFEEAARTHQGRADLGTAAKAVGIGTAPLSRLGGISVRQAVGLRNAISAQTLRRLSSSIRDVLNSVAGLAAGASPASITGSASGSLNYLIHLVEA
jgi:hypothetical protein